MTREAAVALGLVEAGNDMRRVVVITHDCDLLRVEKERFVEAIVADQISKLSSDCRYAKHPRQLHIRYDGNSGAAPLFLELRHVERRCVPIGNFAQYAVRDKTAILSLEEKRSLKQWLAARYGRPAFPDVFENRLRVRNENRTVLDQIAKILRKIEAQHLVGLFFDLGEHRSAEVVDGEPYVLRVSVVFDANEGGVEARKTAEHVAGQLHQLFVSTYGTPDVATMIALESCEAVADTHMTVADLRRVDQWRLEYISLGDEDGGALLAAGEMPA